MLYAVGLLVAVVIVYFMLKKDKKKKVMIGLVVNSPIRDKVIQATNAEEDLLKHSRYFILAILCSFHYEAMLGEKEKPLAKFYEKTLNSDAALAYLGFTYYRLLDNYVKRAGFKPETLTKIAESEALFSEYFLKGNLLTQDELLASRAYDLSDVNEDMGNVLYRVCHDFLLSQAQATGAFTEDELATPEYAKDLHGKLIKYVTGTLIMAMNTVDDLAKEK